MFISLILVFFLNATVCPQQPNPQAASQSRSANQLLTGVYRIDIPASDKLYSVVADASSNVPFGEQQRFFIDLAVRLTPPDLLAIEQRDTRISLGSSRSPRMSFVADGATRSTRARDGHVIRVRLSLESIVGSKRLVFTSSGKTEDNFTVVFESIDNGTKLRVVRRIEADGLNQPLVIQTVYNKISEVARWELYGEPQIAGDRASASTVASSATSSTPSRQPTSPGSTTASGSPAIDVGAAGVLRNALYEWIAATNERDIDKQMTFYVPQLKAYYLTRNTSRAFVRAEKARVFSTAAVIDIRAEEPELIFQDGGRTAIMRYRKKYRVENGRLSRRGQVIQELRWERTGNEWRIFSERDIRVLR
ncbi:MAG TPA: hypothetical protein VEW46_06350 [Pyrinomonadaceae bacterium]|nr:hypothetical protein [Pyrinomonadaceae bacterium]